MDGASDAKPPGGSPAPEDPVAKLLAEREARKARRGTRSRSFYERKKPAGERSFSERMTPSPGKTSFSERRSPSSARANGRSPLPADLPASPAASPAASQELERLRDALSTARLELASMRRNNVANLQRLQSERDAFARQLALEQAEISPESRRGLAGLQEELQAARLRSGRLEEENARLRAERKGLALRATAARTMDAASTGYEKVVVDLIEVKLRCATLSDEKEELMHENRVQRSDNVHLSEANRLLEKSRSEWVVKCADLERQIQAGKGIVNNAANGASGKRVSFAGMKKGDSMSQSSELQELAL